MILIINGASSSGKTSICNEINRISSNHFVYVSFDEYIANINKISKRLFPFGSQLNETEKEVFSSSIGEVIIELFFKSIFVLYRTKREILVDFIFQEHKWYEMFMSMKTNEEVKIVGIKCGLDELMKRELMRKDRVTGLAKYQFEKVHMGINYDIEVESDLESIETNAIIILNKMNDITIAST